MSQLYSAEDIQYRKELNMYLTHEVEHLRKLDVEKYENDIKQLKNLIAQNNKAIAAGEKIQPTSTWIKLKIHDNYEILSDEPHYIRKKSSGKIVTESLVSDLYRCRIEGKSLPKHRILASQFLNLDISDKNMIVSHIDGDKKNNSLNNLRVISRNESQLNKSVGNKIKYEFIEKLSDEAIPVLNFNSSSFENLYFQDDNFYLYTGVRYRKLPVSTGCDGDRYVSATTTEKKSRRISIDVFKVLQNMK